MFFEDSHPIKTRKRGISLRAVPAYSIMQCTCTHIREEAIQNYRDTFEEGTDADNPDRVFPNDGRYLWAAPSAIQSKIIYLEGPKDANWMAEKSANHAERLRHEAEQVRDECEKLVLQATHGLL